MKTKKKKNVRNVVLLGSPKSGKTTFAESMMFEGKVIDRRGSIEAKNTMSDNTEIEQIYQRSIYSTLLYTEYNDTKFNIIDTPGSDDFVGGVYSAFTVCDSGIVLVNATQGVEVGTELFIRQAQKAGKPVVIAVNQLDSDKADWHQAIESLKNVYGGKIIQVQFPVSVGADFNAFIDVLKMKMYRFKDENGTREELDIPADLQAEAEELQQQLIEKAAENDEQLMEIFFDKGSLTEDEVRSGLRAGMLADEIFPVFCLSAKKDIGVKRVMEFVINTLPNPGEHEAELKDGGSMKVDANGPTALYFYKTALEQHLGDVAYFKVMSGTLKEGMDLVNPETGDKERVSIIYAAAGKKREKVSEMKAGDIGCTVKLKSVKAGQTLCAGAEIVYAPTKFPDPKFRTAIKAKEEKDEEKLGEILNRASAEDPTIIVEYSKELKQTILSGQGEHHINILKWKINNVDKLEIELMAPKIPYRETITKVATADYRHKKQSGGAGQFGEVHLLIEPYYEGKPENNKFKVNNQEMILNVKGKEEYPLEWGGKLEYYNCVVGGAIDARFMPAILKGVMQRMEQGPLTGCYARDVRVIVYDGKMHPVDSNELSFMLAGRQAFAQAFKEAGPKILEPIYDVEVLVPSDKMGDVMSDLQGRRGMIVGMTSESGYEKLTAKVPLKEMANYSTALSSLTGGRASFVMTFASYELVPGEVQQKLIAEYQASQAES